MRLLVYSQNPPVGYRVVERVLEAMPEDGRRRACELVGRLVGDIASEAAEAIRVMDLKDARSLVGELRLINQIQELCEGVAAREAAPIPEEAEVAAPRIYGSEGAARVSEAENRE